MAAADQVVCPFFGVVFERLKSLIHKDHIKKLGPLVKELKKLYTTFCKIIKVLNDAEERQFIEKEEAYGIRFWLQELNDAAYKTDDVFDEFEYEGLQQLASKEASSSSNNVSELYGKIQKLNEIFHELNEECLGLELQNEKVKSMVVSPERITISLLTEPQAYGRDEDREKLVKQLLGSAYLTLDQYHTQISKHPKAIREPVHNNASSSSRGNISVFPILGMGGLGKTTLAQLVYNDKRVENHFKDRSWVCVTDDFDIKRLMKAVIASISGSECNLEDLELLQRRLQKEVHGKRFLLVLDDVWEENQEEWNKMMGFFAGGAQGSSIIVTTRLPTVASITSTIPPHCLSALSKKDCWALFKQYAFGPGNEERKALVKIGKAIVKKCGGLPLAAKAMGGLLRFKNEENEWNEVKDSAIWELPQSHVKGILPALRLSYYHLSSMLKQCFVYCSVFPKDFNIEKEGLIQLWMANGLVQSRAKLELEDVGNEIFNVLLQRSFFQDVKKDEDGGIITCKMHDLVHDLASYIAGDEYFVEGVGSARNITERTHHLSLLSYREVPPTSILESMHRSLPCLRSLIRLSGVSATVKFVFSDFILLRALDLNSSSIEVVPDCIGKMIHLRYLNLSGNPFTSLPESICLLRNNQTLKLSWCFELTSLPKNIGNMSSLRHLDIQGCVRLSSMPIGIRQLTCLRTLSNFIVGKESESGVDGLQGLNNLRGELIIAGLQHVKNSMETKKANVMSKKNLHSLGLIWSKYCYLSDSYWWYSQRTQQQQNVIEGLQPHANVRKLFVEGYEGVTCSPSWLTTSLVPNLAEISLSDCTCEHLGSLRKLPRLKVLKLCKMDSLKFIEVDNACTGGFPSLEELSLESMHNLEVWLLSSSSSSYQAAATIIQVAVFPCLKEVILKGCPKLKGVPLSWSPIQHVEIDYCNGMVLGSLQDLPCLPSLTISGFDELEYFPLGTLRNLTALQKLFIHACHSLKALPVELNSLTTLIELHILGCINLVSFVEEGEGGLKNLSSLKTLVIEDCDALKGLPELDKTSLVTLRIIDSPRMKFSKKDFEHLVSLEELQLSNLPNLTCFPEGIKHSAATLQHLQIGAQWFNNVIDLPDWIGSLTSLEYLSIEAPKNWKVLPQWMQHLTALKTLKVYRCDEELVKQWRKMDKQGEHYCFDMISHVPDVEINSRKH